MGLSAAKIPVRFNGSMLPGPNFAETFKRQVRLKEFMRGAELRRDRLGGEVSAADRAFHCGRPARARPIPRKK